MKMNRREIVIAGLCSTAGWLVQRLGGGVSHASLESSPKVNWKQPRKVDVAQSARLAYDGYKEKGLGCCHGVFKGLVTPGIEEMGPIRPVPC